MTLQELDDIFQSLVRNDRQLSAIRKKIKDGKATFKDTAAYNERISTLFGETLSRYITDIPEDQRKDVCEKLLRGRYIDMNSKLAQVQTALDEAEGIRIAPQRLAFPTERVRKVAGALEDKTASEEVIRRRANGPVANVSKSFHDDYMKTNAAFRSRMGIKCYIDRVAAPGCCEWCTKIAGHYRYGEEPKDVYRRHDNCSCTTTYKNGRERQDVWSKKTWNAPEPGAGAAPLTVFNSETRPEGFQPTILTKQSISDKIKLHDSDELWYPITESSLKNIPHITAFGSDDLNRAIEDRCREILSDLIDKEVGTEKTISIRISNLSYEHRTGVLGEGAVLPIKLNEPYISIHNHPSDETISSRDMRLLCNDENCRAVVVIGNSGRNCYIMQKQDNFDSDGLQRFITEYVKRKITFPSDHEFAKEAVKYGTKYDF